jgi:hypothetical protein
VSGHDPRTCKGVCALLSDVIERRIGWWTRLRIRYHLWRCPQCVAYMKQFECIYRATDAHEPCELPDDFDAVMGRVLDRWLEGDRGDETS